MNRKKDREKLTKLLFENFNVPAFYLVSQEVLSLYSTGRSTGCCLLSGHGFTSAVPIYESSPIQNAVLRMTYGGKDVTDYFSKLLVKKKIIEAKEQGSNPGEVPEDIKEKLGYIALDYEKESEKKIYNSQQSYELPDGSKVTPQKLHIIRFQAPEALFKPELIGSKDLGIHKAIQESIEKCSNDNLF